jgi:hypothetical protein
MGVVGGNGPRRASGVGNASAGASVPGARSAERGSGSEVPEI